LSDINPSVVGDTAPLPFDAPSPEEDEALLAKYPYVDGPLTKLDYGYNVKY